MADMVLLADVKTYMNISGAGEDARLAFIISGVSEARCTKMEALTTAIEKLEPHGERIAALEARVAMLEED